jgi:hypothetical protein
VTIVHLLDAVSRERVSLYFSSLLCGVFEVAVDILPLIDKSAHTLSVAASLLQQRPDQSVQ